MQLACDEGDEDLGSEVDDPVGVDADGDVVVVTTRRRLCRVAVVAAEVATRFSRDGVSQDPVDWMLEPRRLFGGAAALDACLEREPFARAVLLHALCVGMDARPEEVNALRDGIDGPGEPADRLDAFGREDGGDFGGGWWEGGEGDGGGRVRARRLRLYSAMVVVARGGELAHLFHASVASNATVVRERIRARFGVAAAAQAEIQLGVDLDCPATAGMLPPAFREMVERGRRVRWSAMAGLDVTVEHRVPS